MGQAGMQDLLQNHILFQHMENSKLFLDVGAEISTLPPCQNIFVSWGCFVKIFFLCGLFLLPVPMPNTYLQRINYFTHLPLAH